MNGAAGRSTIESINRGTPCYVAVRPLPNNQLLSGTIAHELYHCVQYQEKPKRLGKPALFEDGVANFFEYFLYAWEDPPNTAFDLGGDDGAPHHYEPFKPLYEQPYRSSLFFMYRHNRGMTVLEMDQWVAKHEENNDNPDLKRADLAADTTMANAFARFAVQFHDKKIYYDSRDLPKRPFVKTSQAIVETSENINLATAGDKTEHKIERMRSWTFQKFSAILTPGQTITATVSWTDTPKPTVIVWHRAITGGKPSSEWKKFESHLLQSNCDTVASTHEFLVVPITKENEVTGGINFVRGKDAKCKCSSKQPGQGPIRRSQEDAGLEVRQEGNNTQPVEQTTQTWQLPTPAEAETLSPSTTTNGFTSPTPETPRGPDDGFDGPWSTPRPEENISEEPASPTDPEEEEDESCTPPPSSSQSCLIGHWTANKASMDSHMTNPYFRWTGSSGLSRSSLSGSYSISFTQNTPSQSNTATTTSLLVALHEDLNELQLLTDRRTGAPDSRLNSSYSTQGFAMISVDERGFLPVDGKEAGYIKRMDDETMVHSGSTLVTDPQGETVYFEFMWQKGDGPRGVLFDYVCSGSTLEYNYIGGDFAKSYVFDRV
ncbi:hypothetical protein IQ07DRAFT_592583 [Pyrenochaeta sp. DS3sAY3a]|nr:hypothetical protein IQ07DRAFT_592583 [Pyrenochaeta sp. DS3sAY3a]